MPFEQTQHAARNTPVITDMKVVPSPAATACS